LAILRQPEWHDFGPTFAAEQLAKRHQIQVGKETLRKWMIEAGMWQSKPQRLAEMHGWRPRRSGFGNWCNGTPPSTTGWKGEGRCGT
jgi:hypothetical protein